MASEPKTPGELLFATYLEGRDLNWGFEKLLAGKRPDFRVAHPTTDIVCDVLEPSFRLPPDQAGFFDSVPVVQKAFKQRKRNQAKAAADAGLPFVHVLCSTNSDLPFDPTIVAGAMFGRVGFTFPVGHGVDPPVDPSEHSRQVFGRDGKIRSGVNKDVSAIAVITDFNPTLWRFEERADHELPFSPDLGSGAAVERAFERQRLAQDMHAEGSIDFEAHVARLKVFHNPWASHRLSLEVFGGPHDAQWKDIDGNTYGLIAEGWLSWQRPGILTGSPPHGA